MSHQPHQNIELQPAAHAAINSNCGNIASDMPLIASDMPRNYERNKTKPEIWLREKHENVFCCIRVLWVWNCCRWSSWWRWQWVCAWTAHSHHVNGGKKLNNCKHTIYFLIHLRQSAFGQWLYDIWWFCSYRVNVRFTDILFVHYYCLQHFHRTVKTI